MSKPTRKPAPPAPQTPPPAPIAPPIEASEVPVHRQCPLCHGGNGGVGTCYSTQEETRYYKCDTCGHTWTAIVRLHSTTIEHRTVEVTQRDG